MKPAEFEQRLSTMTDQQFLEFKGDFGGDLTRQGYVNQFYRDPAPWEARLCQLLKIPTEADRAADHAALELRAAQEEAEAAKEANRHAIEANKLAQEANDQSRTANCIAIFAAIAAGLSVILSIIALTSGK